MDAFSERLAWRAIDANLNRASEGLRAAEEYVRFGENDLRLTTELKAFRRELAEASRVFSAEKLLAARDTPGDVGTEIDDVAENRRIDVRDAARANLKRVQQALRAIEEFAKIVAPPAAPAFERLRYASYSLEQRLADPGGRRKRLAQATLYFLLDVRDDLDRTKRLAEEALAGGVDVIQLRDKSATDRTLLQAGEILREATHAARALFIVNDRADVALALEADGVHVGQDELPVTVARSLLGPARLIGLSTHDVEQAIAGEREGADYLGVGPVYPSRTKEFGEFVGVDLIGRIGPRIGIPWFAIGGINQENVSEIVRHGARRIAVSGILRDAAAPTATARSLQRFLKNA